MRICQRSDGIKTFGNHCQGDQISSILNYDNTIENSLSEYEDGFPPIKDGEDYSRFSARRYYENSRGVSTIAHLHGQILFSEAREYPFDYSMRDMVKNRDYKTACKNRMVGSPPPSNHIQEYD